MKNFKSTKRALLSSVMALILCFTMLLGTTFAWFTDSVTSQNNIITAGNLDVELYYMNDETTDWTKVTSETNIFKENTLWEPGHTEVVKLKVVNEGTLALKSQLGINVAEETGSINVNGQAFKLSDYIKFGIVEGEQSYTRDQAIAAVDATATALNVGYSSASIDLLAGESQVVTMVVYMPTTVGNEANAGKNQATPTINLGINLFATQLSYESDSFGPDYDEGAPWTGGVDTAWYFEDPTATEFVISNAEELAGLAALVNGTATAPVTTFAATEPETVHDDFAGKTVKLAGDIDLRGIAWTPIGRIGTTSTDFTYSFRGTFDGQNHTIYNLEVNTYGWAGVFGIAYKADINNLKVSGVSIRANRMAGAVVGQLYGSIDNCHVADADILVTPNAVGDSYDNGDKVGGIVGWIGDNGNNRTLTNCSATGVTLGAYRDVGGIAGYVATTTTVSNNKADNITITVDQETFNYGYKDANAGAIIGRRAGSTTEENNTEGENIVISGTLVKDGLTLKYNGVTGTTTLYRVPADYEGSTVVVPEGVTNIGGYAFAYNSNVEKIVLSSTVTTLNDRAFRDTSASEVILNEGLTNISYQAFRNALNVQSVVIPSTVTTISKEAFQNSGITSLTIPANVTTLEYGACRDMKNLTTVVIEGNVTIPVYAFRACTNLRTVVLTGEDVTFDGKGMIFTNKENGDGSAMTICVANETVKERLLAADTASKDYGGYTIVVGTLSRVANTEELQAALDSAAKGTTIMLAPGVEYGSVVLGRPTQHNDTIYNCSAHGEFTDLNEYLTHMSTTNVWHGTPTYTTNVQDLTIIGAEGATIAGLTATSGHAYGDVYDHVLGIDYDSGSAYYAILNLNNITFKNVNFTGKIDINTSQAESVYDGITFDGCTFTTGGTASSFGPAIRYYNEANNGNVKNITINNCTFTNSYQGLYAHHVNGVTVNGCNFDSIGHNAIALQGHDGNVDLKNVVITGNTFNNVADRIIRFNNVGADSNITIQNNVATNSGDEDGQVMKATSIAAGITTSIKNNDWGTGVVANPELADK